MVCRVAVQVELLAHTAEGCGDDEGLAVLHDANVAQEGLVQDGMHGRLVIVPPRWLTLDLSPICLNVLILPCTIQIMCERDRAA
jgi:hypothetical protein